MHSACKGSTWSITALGKTSRPKLSKLQKAKQQSLIEMKIATDHVLQSDTECNALPCPTLATAMQADHCTDDGAMTFCDIDGFMNDVASQSTCSVDHNCPYRTCLKGLAGRYLLCWVKVGSKFESVVLGQNWAKLPLKGICICITSCDIIRLNVTERSDCRAFL